MSRRAERRASLRVAHSTSCPNVNLSALSSVGPGSGCKCKPRYFTFYRGANGKPVKGERVLNRQVAERALTKLQGQLDEGTAELHRPDARTFNEWADTFETILDTAGRKASTVRAYGPTLRYARQAFGDFRLRAIGNEQLRRFVALIRENENGGTDATVSKHLRQLGAVFQSAVDENPPLIPANPVPRFRKSLKLRVPKGDESFTDAELVALWAAMRTLNYEPVYVAICKAAVTTGARQGELIAADESDLELLAGVLHVRRHYDRASGTLTDPKDAEARDVDLTAPARKVLADWLTIRGSAPGPLFPAPRGERLNGQYVSRLVAKAMREAGIPKVGEGGRKRKPFHAFRACYARILRETGADPQWVQGQLGHSTIDLTIGVYGKWSEARKRSEAEQVSEDAFPL